MDILSIPMAQTTTITIAPGVDFSLAAQCHVVLAIWVTGQHGELLFCLTCITHSLYIHHC